MNVRLIRAGVCQITRNRTRRLPFQHFRSRHRRYAIEILERRDCLAGAFDFDILATSNSAGLTSILPSSSINDRGEVAFVASNAVGQSVYFANGSGDPRIVSFPTPSSDRTYGQEVQINNDGLVGAVDIVAGGTFQRRARYWDSEVPGTFQIIGRSSLPPTNNTYFETMGSFVSFNNGNELAFAGFVDNAWEVHLSNTLTEPYNPPINTSTHVVTLQSGTFFRQFAADNGQVMLGWRAGGIERVTLFNRNGMGSPFSASTSSGWLDLGVRPGISDDARGFSFYGQNADGPGIFFGLNDGGTVTVWRISGVSGDGILAPLEIWTDLNMNGVVDPLEDSGIFSGYSVDSRISVNRSYGVTGIDIYTVAFLASDPTGTQGLYTVQIDATNPLATNVAFQPLNVIGIGGEIPGLTGRVQSIGVHDALNNVGDLTYVVTMDSGIQSVLRSYLKDTDKDSLYDIWETNGLDINGDGQLEIDLPSLGANPNRKDIFVEVDAMVDMAPLPSTLNRVKDAFANVPANLVDNPNGQVGINLHIEYDERDIPRAPFPNTWVEFDALKDIRFGTPAQRTNSIALIAKSLVYRYAIFADRYGGSGSSGIAEIAGNDFMVTLGSWSPSGGTPDQQAGTFMHELGHTLGLRHGGGDNKQFKPNYISVMNYTWQVPFAAYPEGWRLDYSRSALGTLDENALDESLGIGGRMGTRTQVGPLPRRLVNENGAVDFNRNGTIDTATAVAANINDLDPNHPSPTGEILVGHEDWSKLVYNFRRSEGFARGVRAEVEPNDLTFELYTLLNGSDASVVNRQLFYNRSSSTVFGDGSGNPSSAIDTTKLALLPGQTPSFSSYSNYLKGINGMIVDVASLAGTPTSADFQFATWDGISPTGFTLLAVTPTISLIPGGGSLGSSRIKIEFADNAIRNTWLRVTVLANGSTGLSANDVFYFGNVVGDVNIGNVGSPLTVRVNASDTSATRQTPNRSPDPNSVDVSNVYDVNKDGRVDDADTLIVRSNQSRSVIRYFTPPAIVQTAIALPSSDTGESEPIPPVEIARFSSAISPLDVNLDGIVSALDVLVVINRLQRSHAGVGNSAEGYESSLELEPDVDGDGFVAPLDALMVINYLNRRATAESVAKVDWQAMDASMTDSTWIEGMVDEDRSRTRRKSAK